MLRFVLWLTCLCCFSPLQCQIPSSVSGKILDERTRKELSGARVCMDTCSYVIETDSHGDFTLKEIPPGNYDLRLSFEGYRSAVYPIHLTPGTQVALGELYLIPEIGLGPPFDQVPGTPDISGEAFDLSTDFVPLNALDDVYQNRSAFNFSQAFYRVRGYDSKYREITLNGIPVNEPENGRAGFALWGGLNDMFREREVTTGLSPLPVHFGSVGGGVNFMLKPSLNRRGLRISSSASNRFYGGRLMASYNSGDTGADFSYSLSASRRWASEGYVDGTLYDAISFFAAVEYNLGPKDALVFNAFYAPRRMGSRAALTREVATLAGPRYNPFWGYHGKEKRNSRIRRMNRPLFLLNYFHEAAQGSYQLGLLYSRGTRSAGRLGYYNASNPDPVYYRYLPSYYLNGNRVNYDNALLTKDEFLSNPQLNWDELYRVNTSPGNMGNASYLLYDDVQRTEDLTFSLSTSYRLGPGGVFSAGIYSRLTNSEYFAAIRDMLGAEFHPDMDPFSQTNNDLGYSGLKDEEDVFAYSYALNTFRTDGFLRYTINFPGGSAYSSVAGSYFNTYRSGFFANERYPENSSGKGAPVKLAAKSFKGGGEYRITGRHIVGLDLSYMERIPDLRSIYLNPRENQLTVDQVRPESIAAAELRYRMDLPRIKGRTSLFFTEFSRFNEINFYYYDGGVGNAFVQELSQGGQKMHFGGEFSLEYDISSEVKFDLVVAHGVYRYAADPEILISFNTVNEEEVINAEGQYALGPSSLKGLYLSQGPQSAISAGLNYRAADYWWIGVVASYLDRNYVGVSKVRRTQSFFTDPQTNEEVNDISMETADALLRQEKLQPIHYLDLNGGKSWLIHDLYISVFLSVNNLFNAVYETGGYEQNRNANLRDLYNDALSGSPSFGSKYWYGAGRTYFLNLAVNF
ncbi:carboxypeptidase regulatory-like domain-containing protein [Robertkochia flava]|uniref:carboxypeptidase regulatory-like domain-containing protein n=1 Tax=Robertkochia flava TaxID=3447986 RepID=UPI001CCECB5F|nr:carboxypeptidase regulatory-like domain-containing protein [Robertkochia marina]